MNRFLPPLPIGLGICSLGCKSPTTIFKSQGQICCIVGLKNGSSRQSISQPDLFTLFIQWSQKRYHWIRLGEQCSELPSVGMEQKWLSSKHLFCALGATRATRLPRNAFFAPRNARGTRSQK